MEHRANIIHITPFMQVPDLPAALAWFELLGFRPLFRMSNYAYVARDEVAVRVLEARQEDGAAFPPHRGFAYYVDVRDVDAVVAELTPRLENAGIEFKGPVDQALPSAGIHDPRAGRKCFRIRPGAPGRIDLHVLDAAVRTVPRAR